MENTARSTSSGGAPARRAPGAVERPLAASGFEPLRKLYRRYVVIGALFSAGGLLSTLLVGGEVTWLLPSLAIGFGGCFVALGVWGLRVGSASQVLSSSLNLVQAGKLAEAGALLDTLEGNTAAGVVVSRHIQRAMIAVRRGDLDAVVRHADIVVASPRRALFRSTYEVQRAAALGLRAWARAAKGDLEGATSDARAVRAAPVPLPEALAHAALAEAMVLERRGDRAGLAALLRRDRRLLMGGLDVRERAVVRAMQRLLKAAPRSVYRTAAEPKKLEIEEQPTIAEWLDRIAPQLSAFAPRARAAAPATAPVPALVPSAEAIARVEAETPKRSFRRPLKVLALWAVLVAMFLAIWQLMQPESQQEARWEPPPASPFDGPAGALWGVAVTASLVGLFVWLVLRSQKQTGELHRLAAAIASGDDVDAELAEMTASKQDLTAAQAWLLRVAVADRRGHLAQGIAHVDAARARLRTEGARAAAAGMLTPALTGARAYLLAAMGRVDEAVAELARIPPDYLLLDRTRFAVQLVALLARGDVDGAGRLVEATPQELSIGPRDELLRDLVRASTAPGGAGSAEIARLRDELRDDEESRRWIEQVAPALLARFDQVTGPIEDGGSHEEKQAAEREGAQSEAAQIASAEHEAAAHEAAEHEAAAHEEAAAEEAAAQLGAPRA